jgi:hypothetical protein
LAVVEPIHKLNFHLIDLATVDRKLELYLEALYCGNASISVATYAYASIGFDRTLARGLRELPLAKATLAGWNKEEPGLSVAPSPFAATALVAQWLRHGGASEVLHHKRLTFDEIQFRGRWRSIKSVQWYMKAGRLFAQARKLKASHLVAAERAIRSFALLF